MPKSHPQELRIAIVEEYYAGGISQRDIAKKYSVGKTWVFRLLKKERLRRNHAAKMEQRSRRHLKIIKNSSQLETN